MDLHLRGKSVLITGASKGIGADAAAAFAEEGCNLHLAARSEDQLESVAQPLRKAHGIEVTCHPTDLRNSDQLADLARAAGNANILVNNAGDVPQDTLAVIDEATWRHAWDLKIFGYINLSRLIYPQMKAHGGGVIVNVIGSAGEKPNARYIAASSGNAALMAFSRSLGGASLRDNIRVVAINPGPVETDRLVTLLKSQAHKKFNDETRWPEMARNYPLGRAAKPREITDMMTFLASDRSSYTTGVVVTIDGGLTSGY